MVRTVPLLSMHHRGSWGTRRRAEPSRFGIALGAIATVGLAVRVAAVAGWYRHLELGPTDNYFYWAQARAVARGDGFINPFEAGDVASATHPPLYSTYLSIFARVGLDTPTQFRLASCLLGMATIVVIGITARRIAGVRAGLISAGIAALFPPLWIADGTLVSESIYALVIALVLLAGHSMATRRDARAAALLGLTIGLAALARSEGLALVVLLAWPLAALAHGLPWRRRFALAGVATAVALLTISPWVIRNLVQFDETVVMSDSTGYVLALGNCDQTYSGAYLGYWHFDCTFVPGPGVSRTRGDLQAREQATRYMREHKTPPARGRWRPGSVACGTSTGWTRASTSTCSTNAASGSRRPWPSRRSTSPRRSRSSGCGPVGATRAAWCCSRRWWSARPRRLRSRSA